MTVPRHALLLAGSPRTRSTSLSLGRFLLEQLTERGLTVATHRLEPLPGSPGGDAALTASVSEADLIILAFPLYVDCQPAHVIRAMEVMGGSRAGRGKGLATLLNCGFPEAGQNRTALAICRHFAAAAGFRWLGGLGLGMGGVIGGRPLAEAGGPGRQAMEALEVAAAALAGGGEIPAGAVELMERQAVPAATFVMLGNRYWERRAREHALAGRMRDQPYRR